MKSVSFSMDSILVFFFSSRRRHTRCSRDWSSDVCSSDLVPNSILQNTNFCERFWHGCIHPEALGALWTDGPGKALTHIFKCVICVNAISAKDTEPHTRR